MSEKKSTCGKCGWLRSNVCRCAIANGYLKIDEKTKPTTIVSGELPLRPGQFIERIKPTLEKFLPRGTYGFADNGDIHLLRGLRKIEIKVGDRQSYIDRVKLDIEKLCA